MKSNPQVHLKFQTVFTAGLFGVLFVLLVWLLSKRYSVLMPDILKMSTVIVGVVWAFSIHIYNKLFDLTDVSGMTYEEHERLEFFVHNRLANFWRSAFLIGILGMLAWMPSIYREATKSTVPLYIILIGAFAIGVASYMLARLLIIQEEIRVFRSQLKQNARKEEERKKLLGEFKNEV